MTVKELTPDSLMLRQIDGQWQKFCGLLMYKLAPLGSSVNITMKDIEDCMKAFTPDEMVVLVHGHYDSITFRLVSKTEAMMLAQQEDKKTGHA